MRSRLKEAWLFLTESKDNLRDVEEASSGRSLVAGVNALFRAAEQELPPERRILDDPWATHLCEDHLLVRALAALRHAVPPLKREIEALKTAHCTRHRAIDALVLRALDEGFEQIVLIGAGNDMRATRFAARLEGVRWLEVDLPSTAAHKWATLAGVEGVNVAGVERAPTDLIGQGLAVALERSSFDPARSACFVLEGLIHYLPPESFGQLRADMARGGGARRVVLSFIDPDMVRRSSGTFGNLVRVLREVPRQYFRPPELEALMAGEGFAMTGHWPFAAQVADFAPQAAQRPIGVSQDVAQFDRPDGAPLDRSGAEP